RLVVAGIDDWGGGSPVTPDFVNPEAPWPHLEALAAATERAGKVLAERLCIYPSYVLAPHRWLDPPVRPSGLPHSDSVGLPRDNWFAGKRGHTPFFKPLKRRAVQKSCMSPFFSFEVRGGEFEEVCAAADELRAKVNGETVTYVVNRNINYTNIC